MNWWIKRSYIRPLIHTGKFWYHAVLWVAGRSVDWGGWARKVLRERGGLQFSRRPQSQSQDHCSWLWTPLYCLRYIENTRISGGLQARRRRGLVLKAPVSRRAKNSWYLSCCCQFSSWSQVGLRFCCQYLCLLWYFRFCFVCLFVSRFSPRSREQLPTGREFLGDWASLQCASQKRYGCRKTSGLWTLCKKMFASCAVLSQNLRMPYLSWYRRRAWVGSEKGPAYTMPTVQRNSRDWCLVHRVWNQVRVLFLFGVSTLRRPG